LFSLNQYISGTETIPGALDKGVATATIRINPNMTAISSAMISASFPNWPDEILRPVSRESKVHAKRRPETESQIERLVADIRILVGCLLLAGCLAGPILADAQLPPTIIAAPTNQAVALGGSVKLSATASGQAPLSYQWFKDSRRILGATNSALTITNASLINSGSYYVMLTNGSGMVISLPALVAVGNPALLAWGYNYFGQVGNGTRDTLVTQPFSVASNVVAGAAGAFHSLFITVDGTLWAMGEDQSGELCNSTNSIFPFTTPINAVSNVVAAAAGQAFSLFITADGILWAIGGNTYGQLGDGTTDFHLDPTPVSVASNVVAVAAGLCHSLFVMADGTLWAMGWGTSGQLGNGSTATINDLPVCVASNVVAVAAGYQHSLFVKTDGTLWAMGLNADGELGIGTTINKDVPVRVATNVMAVAAGGLHSLFMTTNGALWAMGNNSYGQLGNGNTNNALTPVCVVTNVTAVAAGFFDSLFATTNGELWAMGANYNGQLGIGTTSDTNRPTQVPHLSVANIFPADPRNTTLALGILYTANSIILTGKIPTMNFLGMPGASYSVERSTDLSVWSRIWTTNEPGSGMFRFTDSAAPQPKAYYRLQPGP
jgi:alpha-tubulin suppressor-like RCC1 family protein